MPKPNSVSWKEYTRAAWDRDLNLNAGEGLEPEAAEKAVAAELDATLGCKVWRLNNLYHIVNAKGKRILFRMKPGMYDWMYHQHWRNVLLKARQYGATTFWSLDMFDDILWKPNLHCQLTAHKLEDAAKIFSDKVIYAWEHLGEIPADAEPHAGLTREEWATLAADLKGKVGEKKRTAEELLLTNNSSIRVTTSGRSGTLQRLHISELGKISVEYPQKAREIKTGSLPAAKWGKVWIESTAEGQEGWFYELCQEAEKNMMEGVELTRLDWQFHFHPWYDDDDYFLPTEEAIRVIIQPRMRVYFEELQAGEGIKLSMEQKAWYVKTEGGQSGLGGDMKREHPSTPKEAFEVSVEGVVYADQMRALRLSGRLCPLPVVDGLPVNTYWDLGATSSYMAIVFAQRWGGEFRVIDYEENHNEPMKFYADLLVDKKEEFGWTFGTHYAPHDIAHTELISGLPRWKGAQNLGLIFQKTKRPRRKVEGIQAVKSMFSTISIDNVNGDVLVKHLDNWRYEWDELRGRWRDEPRDDNHTHACDAVQTAAMVDHIAQAAGNQKRRNVVPRKMGGHT